MGGDAPSCWHESCGKQAAWHCTMDNRDYCPDHVHGSGAVCCLEMIDPDMWEQEQRY